MARNSITGLGGISVLSRRRPFVVWCPELGEDKPDEGTTVHAEDHEGAAQNRARDHFYGDPVSDHILLTEGLTFYVLDDGAAGEAKRLHVVGVPTVSWSVRDGQ